ncbi:hypothetical protein K435DRAFT_654792 [Dendrothele bispora CBS 962.96]|uniref:Protein kinase domain-containing protein n=1 Tax=Dendrothele bispora (strain CBS 962.96) TaxID=1314807 RepID=A0A4S8MG97_DENBC|nr:hypothetical protein K435DRAFT_654792 [Dendrothele bispora CBS 962.96]
MLSSGLLRSHSVGLVVDSNILQITYYDRSKIVLSERIDLSKNEGQTVFLTSLHQLVFLEDRKQGFLPVTVGSAAFSLPIIRPRMNPNYLSAMEGEGRDLTKSAGFSFSRDTFYGCQLTLAPDKIVDLKEVVHRAHGTIGRGTTVIRATMKVNGVERDVAVKISYPGKNRVAEDKLVEQARKMAQGEHSWVQNHLPEILFSRTYDFAEDMPENRLAEYFESHDIPYERRVLRIIVQDYLDPITKLTDPRAYAQAFFDVLQVHRWLVDHPKILHRDISLQNIMLRRRDDQTYAVLNDFDLSSPLPLKGGPTSLQRTGTKPYMSPDLLDTDCNTQEAMIPAYRHDLETIFYVILVFCSQYEGPSKVAKKPKVAKKEFSNWFTSPNQDVAASKRLWITGTREIRPTEFFGEFFEGYLFNLKCCIAGGYCAKDNFLLKSRLYERYGGEHPGLFEWFTLGGTVTYEKFKNIMGEYMGQPLLDRYAQPAPLNDKDFTPLP